jgi:hypothetical protein
MFKDVGSGVKDLLEEDYFYTQRLNIKTTNASNLSWLTKGEMSHKGVNASMTATKKGEVISLDKLRVKSDGKVTLEGSLKTNEFSKFTMGMEDGHQERGKPLYSYGTLGVELSMPSLCGSAVVDVVNGPVLKANMMVNLNSVWKVGGEATVNSRYEEKDQMPEVSDINVGMSYKG